MTGFASTETAIEALRTGALDYISKPFDVDEMKRVVAQALEAAPGAAGRSANRRRAPMPTAGRRHDGRGRAPRCSASSR